MKTAGSAGTTPTTRVWALAAALLLLGTLLAPVGAWADEGSPVAADGNAPEAAAENSSGAAPEPAPEAQAVDPIHATAAKVLEVASIDPAALFARYHNWTAVETVDFTSANEDGSLSVWQDGWYIAHDWSDYGRVIADLQPGDAITVNGQTTLITGKSIWAQDTYTNWDIFDVIGWDKYVFQTCLGDDELWIAYGFDVHPTPQFLAEHGIEG